MTDYLEQAKTNRANDNLKASTNAALIAIAEALQQRASDRDEIKSLIDERDELAAIVEGDDHTAAKYYRLMWEVDDRACSAEAQLAALQELVDGEAWERMTAELDQLREVVAGADHTTATYYRRMRLAENRADAHHRELAKAQEIIRIVAMDWGSRCANPETCSCSMAQAVRYARQLEERSDADPT